MAGREPEAGHLDPEAAFSAFRRTEFDLINREFWRMNTELILARAVQSSRDGTGCWISGAGWGDLHNSSADPVDVTSGSTPASPPRYGRRGYNGEQRVRERFTREGVGARYGQLYQEVLEEA